MKDDPTNEIVLQTKISALIHTDQYKAALEIMKNKPDAYAFETAYCYAQLGEPARALEILTKSDGKDIRSQYLLSQIVCFSLSF